MKWLTPDEVKDKVEMEVLECDCGYHMGIDCTYLEQVGDFKVECPACSAEINTEVIP